jgi:hypothetical protein
MPRSVALTLISVALFVFGGSLFVLPVYGVEVPSPLHELLALCMLLWLPFFIAAIVVRQRERKELQ